MQSVTLKSLKDLLEESKLLTTSGNSFLDRRLTNDNDRNHCYRRPYYKFHMLLAKTIKPGLIVELGIDEGDSCGHFAFGCPTAKVIGVDVHKDGEPPSLHCREVASNFSNFQYIRKWTWDALDDVAALKKPIDILFIDSWHEYDYFARDWNDYHKFLKIGSIIIVDDLQFGEIKQGYDKLPYPNFIDNTMNPAIPYGMMIYDGKSTILDYKKRDFMP